MTHVKISDTKAQEAAVLNAARLNGCKTVLTQADGTRLFQFKLGANAKGFQFDVRNLGVAADIVEG